MPTEKNEKVILLMKDELGEKIMTEFVAIIPKAYSYLMGDSNCYTHATKVAKKLNNKEICNKKNA